MAREKPGGGGVDSTPPAEIGLNEKKIENMKFLFCLKTRKMHKGYNFGSKTTFLGTRSDFLRVYSFPG